MCLGTPRLTGWGLNEPLSDFLHFRPFPGRTRRRKIIRLASKTRHHTQCQDRYALSTASPQVPCGQSNHQQQAYDLMAHLVPCTICSNDSAGPDRLELRYGLPATESLPTITDSDKRACILRVYPLGV